MSESGCKEMKRTPLYQGHVKLAANMVDFGGWAMPVNYPAGILEEHLATRKFGGLFDVSHMGRFLLSGQDALPFLQHVLTNNAAALEPEECHYTIIPNESGGAVDDTYLYRLDPEHYLLVVNAENKEKDWQWLLEHKGGFPKMVIEDHTADITMMALQGPRAKAVLEAVLGGDGFVPPGPIRNTITTAKVSGKKVPVARTGYTGEPISFELFPPAEIAVAIWNDILEVGANEGIVPIGLGARDTLRLEAYLPLYGHELGTDIEGKEIPIFSGRLARSCVSFSNLKGAYVGREALLNQFEELNLRLEDSLDKPREELLVPRMIQPVAVTGAGVARAGCEVYIDKTLVGNVTSGTVVPYWKPEGYGIMSKPGAQSERRAICLAYLDADLREGQELQIQVRNRWVPAVITERHLAGEAAPFARPILVEKVGSYV